jgi:hypothetical protein
MKSIAKIIRCAAAATFLTTAFAPRVPAQNADDDDRRRDCRNAVGRERRRCESEPEGLGNALIIPDDLEREAQLRMEQISEDLGSLQTATNYLSRAATQNGELDLKAIVKSASEVRKRAGRLRDSLALPNPQVGAEYREEKVPTDPRELRAALSSLSSLISHAVRNPALRGYVLDVTRSSKARGELEEIVELSERIKMSSEMLGKNRR